MQLISCRSNVESRLALVVLVVVFTLIVQLCAGADAPKDSSILKAAAVDGAGISASVDLKVPVPDSKSPATGSPPSAPPTTPPLPPPPPPPPPPPTPPPPSPSSNPPPPPPPSSPKSSPPTPPPPPPTMSPSSNPSSPPPSTTSRSGSNFFNPFDTSSGFNAFGPGGNSSPGSTNENRRLGGSTIAQKGTGSSGSRGTAGQPHEEEGEAEGNGDLDNKEKDKTANTAAASKDQESGDGSISVGGVIGIVLGCVVVTLFLVAAVMRRTRRVRNRRYEEPTFTDLENDPFKMHLDQHHQQYQVIGGAPGFNKPS